MFTFCLPLVQYSSLIKHQSPLKHMRFWCTIFDECCLLVVSDMPHNVEFVWFLFIHVLVHVVGNGVYTCVVWPIQPSKHCVLWFYQNGPTPHPTRNPQLTTSAATRSLLVRTLPRHGTNSVVIGCLCMTMKKQTNVNRHRKALLVSTLLFVFYT